MNTYVPIFRGLDARGGRKLRTDTHTHTNTRDNYSNPRCAHARRGLTTVQCSICSQLNNKPKVVVTDFRLHHTCRIILWLHSQSGVIRSLLCNPGTFSPGARRSCPRALVTYLRILYCGYAHEGGKQMYCNF